ncbi:MAG: hypothetical protein WD623_04740 [Marinobacter sp.]|uniref:hypothetical protein n=1 Tax=Marinobacter sp. TaxID=50741 RepID=UPI0034A024D1
MPLPLSSPTNCFGGYLLELLRDSILREWLDLLAIDKDGNLVIIENKLDDSGQDVERQTPTIKESLAVRPIDSESRLAKE